MRSTALIVALTLLAPAVEAADDALCTQVTAQVDAWKQATFRVERRMEVVFDGELKARMLDEVTFKEGRVSVRQLSREVLDESLDLDEEDGDPAQRFEVRCKQIEEIEAGRYRLTSRDGFDQLTLRLAKGRLPVIEEWTHTQTIRVLFRKLRVFMRAVYGAPHPPSPPGKIPQ